MVNYAVWAIVIVGHVAEDVLGHNAAANGGLSALHKDCSLRSINIAVESDIGLKLDGGTRH